MTSKQMPPPGDPYYSSLQYKLECVLESLESALELLPEQSMAWAMCYDSARDVKDMLGRGQDPYKHVEYKRVQRW